MDTLRRSRSTNDIGHATVTTSAFSIPPLPRPSINNTEHPSAHDNNPLIPAETQPYVPHGRIRRIIAFFGYGSPTLRARRALVSLYTSLTLYTVQFVIIVVVLIIAGKTKSPTNPSLNEWQACSKPLGIWGALWVARTCFAAVLAYWGWRRGPRTRQVNSSPESGTGGSNIHDVESARPPILHTGTAQSFSTILADRATSPPLAPESKLFTRLSVLSSLATLAWFLTAHIFEYTSIDTCRHSSPHLFWLVFGILCILYFMVLEVVMLGFTVFIIAPLLFLFWNLVLFILGRHPLQNPDIKPEIGKLPKAIVDRIPLVIYIPSPPEDEVTSKLGADITTPPVSYPPKLPIKSPAIKPKRRFKFLRPMGGHKGGKDSAKDKSKLDESAAEQGKGTWESNWEPSEYPFVRLDGNRAVCSICLMDFEEPPRVDAGGQNAVGAPESGEEQAPVASTSNAAAADKAGQGLIEQVPTETMTDDEHEAELRLADAGEGSQPLRLLACGHAFHKTCIDPWLTDVSGRCAVCQRPVEISKTEKEEKPQRRWFWQRR